MQKKLEKAIHDRLDEINELREELEDLQRDMEQEILAREKIIQGLKSELQYLKQQFEETVAAMQEEYNKLKAKYDQEVGPGGVQDAKQKAERLERDLAALREVVEQLKNKIIELKGIIREKDMEYEEIQKETMDLLFIKEAAYKKLASDNADLTLKLEEQEFIKKEMMAKFQKDLFKMKKHFDREMKKLEVVIGEREAVIEQQKEWLVEIAHWKAEHEKRIDEKVEAEAECERKVQKREEGMLKVSFGKTGFGFYAFLLNCGYYRRESYSYLSVGVAHVV